MEPQVIEAGQNQMIVLYVTGDSGSMIDPVYHWTRIGEHAGTLSVDGWRIVSAAVMPLRQTGTAGNVFFQSGGQFATQEAIAVIYAR